MKVLIFVSLFIAIVNSMAIKNNGRNIETTPTTVEATRVQHDKRAKTTTYREIEKVPIFMGGDEQYSGDWSESSWGQVKTGGNIVDGVIKVAIPKPDGYAIGSSSLDSNYGKLSFKYKISSSAPQAKLNILTYEGDDPNAYINLTTLTYSGDDYEEFEIYVKNYKTSSFISSIKRFAFQNYETEGDFILYLKDVVYTNIEYIIEKYDSPISFIDDDECILSSLWEITSDNADLISFKYDNNKNQCIMNINVTEDPIKFKLKNVKFHGGKFEFTAKKNSGSGSFSWVGTNSENENNRSQEDTHEISASSTEFVGEFDNDDEEFDTIEIFSFSDNINCEISKMQFSPIAVDGLVRLYEVTHLDEPDVILDETGLYWTDASWGSTECKFDEINGYMECSFEGRPSSWPGFAFRTDNLYDAGTLVVEMKTSEPTHNIQILSFDVEGEKEVSTVVKAFTATEEFKIYKFELKHFDEYPTVKYAIQEASQQNSIFYIKNIVYYPDYIEIPDDPIPRKSTNTDTDPSVNPNVDPPKTEEVLYQEKGYDGCAPETKAVFHDENGLWGIENNKWCAILSKNIDACWSIIFGYKCCTDNAKPTENEAWGEENGEKCGINKKNVCWAKEMNYECCSRKSTAVVLIDESGVWGVKDNKWCGII